MDYTKASHELRAGKKLRRKAWLNQADFIYLTNPRTVPIGSWRATSNGTRPTEKELSEGYVTLTAHMDGYIGGMRYIGIAVSEEDRQADDWEVIG